MQVDEYLTPEEYLKRVKELDENQEKDLKEKWKEFYVNVTLHGFHYIFDQTGIRRLGWLIVVVASGVLAFYLFQGIISDYSKLKTIAISREVFAKDSMDFPTFSICPFNAVTYNRIPAEPDFQKFWSFFENYHKNMTGHEEDLIEKLIELMEELNETSFSEFIEHFEISLHLMMHNEVVKATGFTPCQFGDEHCDSTSFKKIFPFPYDDFGLCHQFNMYQPGKEVKHIKLGGGMGMTLNIFADNMAVQKKPYHGLAIFIHEYGSPLSLSHATYVPISPGTINMLFVDVEQKHLLPPPYDSQCGKKPFEYIDSRFPYTQAMCQLDCQAVYLFKKVQCLGLQYLHYVDNKTLCVNASQFITYRSAMALLEKEQIHLKCHKTCPVECKSLKYSISTSQTKLGTKNTFDAIMSSPEWTKNYEETKDYVSSNIISLKIAFSDQSTHVQDLVPSVTWASMIGSVGGTLGLCLGFSILTLCEFLYFALNVLLSMLRIRKSKKHIKTRTLHDGQQLQKLTTDSQKTACLQNSDLEEMQL